MIQLAFLFVLVLALLAFQNWRAGFALCVLMALFQDPMRKLVAGQPVYFIVFVGAVFGAAWIGAFTRGVSMFPGRIVGWRQHVGKPFNLFVLLAILQAAHSLIVYMNPIMTGLGVMFYFAPIAAFMLAYRFALARSELGVLRWMRFYVIAATLALGTVYLEFAGADSIMFGEVGGGVMISGQGAYYKGNSGTFRAAEIAAWHAATVACFAFILFWGKRFSPPKFLLALAFIAFLIGIGTLTGRRKMIIEIVIFISVYFCLIGWFRRGSIRLAVVALLLGIGSYTMTVGSMEPDRGDGRYAVERLEESRSNNFSRYSERARTVFADAPERALNLGVQPVAWAVAAHGWLGAGLGVGSQGAARFSAVTSGAAEGGLGKITVELGVPGLLLVFWLLIAMVRYVWRILGALARTSELHANLAFGIVAFIIANGAAFAVATQAYGDLFVLLTLGWSFGFLLALPVLAEAAQQPAATRVVPVPPTR